MTPMNFESALDALKKGLKLTRACWNPKTTFVKLQRPDLTSKMTVPYVYLEYPQGHPVYPDGARIPWFASNADLLAEDWEIRK